MNVDLAKYASTLESSEGRSHPVFMPSLTLVALVSEFFVSFFRHTACSEVGGVSVPSYVN